ncbi:MAG: Gfo/Idh/MocA family oxidoreductase [Candidatus Pacebacteria bacterium]|nr:Gfo/Idh/MocA family oxidoreductase [Candidatus Paceibacterota bacterium]
MSDNNDVRLGIAGLGFGAVVHLPVWQNIDGVKVVAVADQNLVKAQELATKYHIDFAFESFQTLLQHPDLDAVSLALPPQKNAQACELALKRGLAVLTEKPLADSLKNARLLAKLAKGQTALVDFEFSEGPAFQSLKKIINQDTLGPIQHINVTWLTNSYAQRQRIWCWKTDVKQLGGAVSLLGSHLFYLLEWLVGPMSKVGADLSSRATQKFAPQGSHPADDLAHLLLVNEQGLRVAMIIGNASCGSSVHRWEVIGEKGTAVLENQSLDPLSGFSLWLSHGEAKRDLIYQDAESLVSDGRIAALQNLAQLFIAAIKNKQVVKPDFTDGLRVQSIMEAAYRSGKKNHLISIEK